MRRTDVTGILLAGGESRRFGAPKALARLDGATFLERIAAALQPHAGTLLVSVRRDGAGVLEAALPSGARCVEDLRPGAGPLAGVEAALQGVTTPVALVVACDYPFLRAEDAGRLLESLGPHDAAAPEVEGRIQPLCAAYDVRIAPRLTAWLDSGRREVLGFLRLLDLATVAATDPGSVRAFTNVNSPADLEIPS